MREQKRLLSLLLLLALPGAPAFSATDVTPAAPASRPGIAGLSIHPEKLEISTVNLAHGPALLARIPGHFARAQWQLLWEEEIPTDSQGNFVLELPLESVETRITLRAVGLLGEVETQEVTVVVPDFEERRDRLEIQTTAASRIRTHLGLAITSLSYSETDLSRRGWFSPTLQLNVRTTLVPRQWELQASGFANLLPFGAERETDQARFFGVNLRAGWEMLESDRLSVSLLGGIYFLTMSVPSAEFGFRNIAGPQLYPQFRYFTGLRRSISGYLKFSPITDGIVPLSLRSRETALGLAHHWHWRSGRSLSVNLDLSSLRLIHPDSRAGREVSLEARTLSLGIGVQW
ncbi:MAG: hypothetical protein NDJ89_01185 [Oligoflexia bacterium]|nr:hypothetical protein [Oligoflexia bacterium]